MIETWKDIIGFEGLYQISDMGRVISLERPRRDKPNYIIKEKILKQGKSSHGYFSVSLCNQVQKVFEVHRLVAKHFIENPHNLPEVNHKSGNREDNRASKLEWCTHQQNMDHAWGTGLIKRNKLICLNSGKLFTYMEAAVSVNCSHQHLHDMMSGRRTNWTSFKKITA